MLRAFESPSARAARTYSKLRARRNSARTTPTSDTQERAAGYRAGTKKLGVMIDEMMIRR